jgi:hypothetical protein
MARTWANALVLVGIASAVLLGATHRSPSLAHPQRQGGSPAHQALEERAARDPGDAPAAQALARSYLDRGDPGLAVAVLERSPSAIDSASSADFAAVAYLNAGLGTASLSMTRKALDLCERQTCEASLIARAARREELLQAVLEMGVEDVTRHPEALELAYRRTVRQVRVAMN